MDVEGWQAQYHGIKRNRDSTERFGRSRAIPLRCRAITAIPSRFLRWPQDHFAYEALRRLRDQHADDVAHVFRLQHLFERHARVRRKVGMRRAGANHGDANVVSAKLFGYGIRETIQSPLGSSV